MRSTFPAKVFCIKWLSHIKRNSLLKCVTFSILTILLFRFSFGCGKQLAYAISHTRNEVQHNCSSCISTVIEMYAYIKKEQKNKRRKWKNARRQMQDCDDLQCACGFHESQLRLLSADKFATYSLLSALTDVYTSLYDITSIFLKKTRISFQ